MRGITPDSPNFGPGDLLTVKGPLASDDKSTFLTRVIYREKVGKYR